MGMEMKHSHTEHVTIDHNTQDLSLSNISKIKSKRKARVGGRLKPLSMSARVSLLRSHGILQIDREESADIEKLQVETLFEKSHLKCQSKQLIQKKPPPLIINQVVYN